MSDTVQPTVTVKTEIFELRTTIADAPAFSVGRYDIQPHAATIIYRRQVDVEYWEFIHITIIGVWLTGNLKDKTAYRKYGRMTLDRVPDWLVQFIDSNVPGK